MEIASLSLEDDRVAMEALLKQKPDLDSVIGMDDNWVGEYISPRLTTAHFYYKTSSEKVANLLIEMIQNKGKPGPVHQVMLGYTIKNRDSV